MAEHTTTRPGAADAVGPAPARALGRHRLGADLRRLRQARSLRLDDVAARLEVAPSTLSRIENGLAPARAAYLAVMLDLYGVDDPAQRQRLADMAREGQREAWWAAYASLLPVGAGHMIDLETAASHIRCYAEHIPGLLQTPAYAAAAIHGARPGLTRPQILRLTRLQTLRQEHARAKGHRLHVVIDQPALLRAVSTPAVMAGQLHHLHAITADPAITVQVAELARSRPVLTPPFALLTLPGQADPYIACHSGIGGQIIMTRRPADLQATHRIFTALAGNAASPEDSAILIKDAAAHWEWQAPPAT